jgi:predicted ABC-type ATPase
MAKRRKPRCIVIAGPNGAGKTTFARRYLPEDERILHFVNTDLLAIGLSPLKPDMFAVYGLGNRLATRSKSCI